MEPSSNNNNVIITEDGQRLTIENGLITGTDNANPGLAHETGNVLDEDNREQNEDGGACPTHPGNSMSDSRE